jgi:hypothetical protein
MEKNQKMWKKSMETWKNVGKKEKKRENRGNKIRIHRLQFLPPHFFLKKCNFSRIFIRKRNKKTANIEI